MKFYKNRRWYNQTQNTEHYNSQYFYSQHRVSSLLDILDMLLYLTSLFVPFKQLQYLYESMSTIN